jgi:hypothetical protein
MKSVVYTLPHRGFQEYQVTAYFYPEEKAF